MTLEFIKKEGNDKLILIFGGWSTLPSFYRDLDISGWDMLVVTSFSDFIFPVNVLESYSTVALFACSLGVYMASKVLDSDRISFAIAINGTTMPVDDLNGIPEEIYKGTIENLDERNLIKFRKRMGGNHYANYQDKFSDTEKIDVLKKQLQFIFDSISDPTTRNGNSLKWNRAYISENDRIFPSKNQKRFWESELDKSKIIITEGPHIPDFERIIKSIVIDKEKIGSRFCKAIESYDRNAAAQKRIAENLVSLSPVTTAERILEIGPGTGYFSRLIDKKLHPREIDFIELYPIEIPEIKASKNYFLDDAEEWMKKYALKDCARYDAIVSSSAMQWFVNPEMFFKNCALLIKQEGFVLLSTFGPGNLTELNIANPYRMLYHSIEDLESMLKKYFKKVEIAEEEITMEFRSKRELLLHIGSTGVGAKSHPGYSLKEILPDLPLSLTYHPIYILAWNPF